MRIGRPKIYMSEEDKLAAKRKRAREWAKRNRKPETYQEKIDKMSQEEYVLFLEREKLRKREQRKRLKEKQTNK